ncbi:MAG TPA: hypothetical protein VGY66_25545 [Gemmataceae bacterium]|jgi:hypothetical protein|nr:hypothetical protein [Gemmataceae bacterium]
MQYSSNPTADDIRQWAFEPDTLSASEDWDLMITGIGFEDLFLELVENPECPKSDFFLHCLYLWVYQNVRGDGPTAEVERLLQRGQASYEPALRRWARRSRALIADPRRADRHLWWGFGQKHSSA